jgi:hypothetical protein
MNCSAVNDQASSWSTRNRKPYIFQFNANTIFRLNSDLNILANRGEEIANHGNIFRSAIKKKGKTTKKERKPDSVDKSSTDEGGIRDKGIHAISLLCYSFEKGAVEAVAKAESSN